MHATTTRHLVDARAGIAAAVAAIIFAAGIAFGTLIDVDVPAVGSTDVAATSDGSYDAVERLRANGGLPTATSDGSYDAVERLRANRGLPTADILPDLSEEDAAKVRGR